MNDGNNNFNTFSYNNFYYMYSAIYFTTGGKGNAFLYNNIGNMDAAVPLYQYGMYIQNASYKKVIGNNFRNNSSATGYYAMYLYSGGDHDTIMYNDISGFTTSYGYAPYLYQSNYSRIAYNKIHDLTFTSYGYVMLGYSCTYAEIDHNEIYNITMPYGYMYFGYSGTYLNIHDNSFHDIMANSTSSGLYLYTFYSIQYSQVKYNKLYNLTGLSSSGIYSMVGNSCSYSRFEGNQFYNWKAPIGYNYGFNNYNCNSDTVINNIFHDFTGTSGYQTVMCAITNYSSTSGLSNVIRGNTIYNITNTGACDVAGIYSYNIDGKYDGNDITGIVNNYASNKTYGILHTGNGSGYGNGAYFMNNKIYGLSCYGTNDYTHGTFGIDLEGTNAGIRVYYNSIYLSGINNNATKYDVSSCIKVGTATQTLLQFVNNIFYNGIPGTSGQKTYAIMLTAAANITNCVYNYNDYYVSASTSKLGNYVPSGDIATLAGWQGTTNQDAASMNIDPLFMSNVSLSLQAASPMFYAGTPISGFNWDALMLARSTSQPTIGAYERLPIIRISPASAAIEVPFGNPPTGPTPFVWTSSPGTDHYTVEVTTGSDFIAGIIASPSVSDTTYNATTLAPTTTYYWRVKAWDIANNQINITGTPVWSFVTSGPILPPVVTKPLAGATNVRFPVVVNWNGVNSALTYRIQISTSSTFATLLKDVTVSTLTNTFDMSGWQQNQLYYMRTQSIKPLFTSVWSSNYTFTTAPMVTPAITAPANFATNLTFPIVVNWTMDTSAAYYNIQVSTDPLFGSLVQSQTSATNTISLPLYNWIFYTKYYVRVNSVNAHLSSNWSSNVQFTTGNQLTPLAEGFEISCPPPGWTHAESGSYPWQRYKTSSDYPFPGGITPHSGDWMGYYNAYYDSPGLHADLITKPFDLSWRGANDVVPFSFWYYKHNYSTGTSGLGGRFTYLEIFANTAPNVTNATLLTNAKTAGVYFGVKIGDEPVESAPGWYQYFANIPASYNGTTNYIIIRAWGDWYNDPNIDDIGIPVPLPTPQAISSVSVSQPASTTLPRGFNRKHQMMAVSFTAPGNFNYKLIKQFNFDLTGTTNTANDIQNVRLYFTGTNGSFDPWMALPSQVVGFVANPTGNSITMNLTNVALAGGTSYFWLTYELPETAPLGDVIHTNLTSIVTMDTTYNISIALPSEYTVRAAVPWDLTAKINLENNNKDSDFVGGGYDGINYMGTRLSQRARVATFDKASNGFSYLREVTVPGFPGAPITETDWDGTYYYTALNSSPSTIYKFTINPPALVASIPIVFTGSSITVNGIAYDPTYNTNQGGFWVSSGNSAIVLLDITGKEVNRIPDANISSLNDRFGLALDYWSPGGPYLWSYGANGNNNLTISQIGNIYSTDPTTRGIPTGLSKDVAQDMNLVGYKQFPGGSYFREDYNTKYVYFGNVTQRDAANTHPALLTEYYFLKDVPMTFLTSSTASASTDYVTPGSSDQEIIQVIVTTEGLTSALTANSFTFNINGTTRAADIVGAKLYYTGNNPTFAASSQFGSTVSTPTGTFTINGTRMLLPGTNYFWLAYDVAYPAQTFHVLDAECTGFTLANTPTAKIPVVTAPAGNRKIMNPMSGPYTVGAPNANFNNFNEAFNAVQVAGFEGNTQLEIISDITEPQTAMLGNWIETNTAGPYNLTVYPSGGDRTVTCINSPITFQFVGTDRLIINGSQDGIGENRNLTIKNDCQQAPPGSNFVTLAIDKDFFNGATNDVIKNCNILGAGNLSTASTYALTIGVNSTVLSGENNRNITISNNAISRAATGIFVSSTSSDTSSHLQGIRILGNDIGSSVASNYITRNGIAMFGAKNLWNYSNPNVIEGNSVFNVTGANNFVRGIWTDNCKGITVNANKVYGLRNTLNAGSVYGIYDNLDSLALITNNAVYNLIAVGSQDITKSIIGIATTTSNDTKIEFNSINLYGTVASSITGLLTANLYSAADNRLQLNNNIFANQLTNPSNIKTYAICFSTFTETASGGGCNYNDYYTSNGMFRAVNAEYNTVSAWAAAVTKSDDYSVTYNPGFVSNTNLDVIITSPMIFAGVARTEVPKDINGFGRYALPTIGAYEYSGGQLLPPPSRLYPKNNQYAADFNPTNFRWTSVPSATYYTLQYSTDANFADANVITVGPVIDTIAPVQLDSTQRYFWRVQARNDFIASNWTVLWWFYTKGTLECPTLLYPANFATNVIQDTLTFEWKPVWAASGYHLQVSSNPNYFPSSYADTAGLVANRFYVDTFGYYKTVYWRVQATNGLDYSCWTQWRFVTNSINTTESFENPKFPPGNAPNNWIDQTNDAINWARVSASSNPPIQYPSILPHTGTWIASYNAHSASAGSTANLISRKFDLSQRVPGDLVPMYFWLYREADQSNGAGTGSMLNVYLDTVQDKSSNARKLDNWNVIYNSDVHTEDSVGWYKYFVYMPEEYAGTSNYIIFQAQSDQYNNIHLDDVKLPSFETAPFPVPYLTFPTNADSSAPQSPRFTWELLAPDSTMGYQYQIEIQDTSYGYGLHVTQTIPNINFYQYGNTLPEKKQYVWRVRVQQNGLNGPWSARFAFVTASYCKGAVTACSPGVTNYISNVTFNTINYDSDCPDTSGYSDFSVYYPYGYYYGPYPNPAGITLVTLGDVVPLTVTANGALPTDLVSAYFDWNQNGVLDDPGEVIMLATTDEGLTFHANVTIPQTSGLGRVKMRVRITSDETISPCGITTTGDVENYGVTVSPVLPVLTVSSISKYSYCRHDSVVVQVTMSNVDADQGNTLEVWLIPTFYGGQNRLLGSFVGVRSQGTYVVRGVIGGTWDAGLYRIRANTTFPYATSDNSNKLSILWSPIQRQLTGGGAYCEGGVGVPISLMTSGDSVTYYLAVNDSTIASSRLQGKNGAPLDFGLQTIPGVYTAYAISDSNCTIDMLGAVSVVRSPAPKKYAIQGGGSYCDGDIPAGVNIGLKGTDNQSLQIGYEQYTTSFPNPFSRYQNANRTQTIVLGSELAGMGLIAGPIGAIGFDIGNLNTVGTVQNWRLKIKATSASTVGGAYDTTGNWTSCVHTGDITPYVGWNKITFDEQYIWDGQSNIMLDWCSYSTSTTSYALVYVSYTSTIMSNYYYVNGNDLCSGYTPPYVYQSYYRPTMKFYVGGSVNPGYKLVKDGKTLENRVGTGAAFSFSNRYKEAGTYYVYGTGIYGCSALMDSTVVKINNSPGRYELHGGGTICQGGAGLPLTLNGSDLDITYNLYQNSFKTTQLNTSQGYTSTASPYYWYYTSWRQQYLVLASELKRIGFPAGPIGGLGFQVGYMYGAAWPLNNFTIKIKHTTNSMTTAPPDESGWTVVYGPTQYTCINGWNDHKFAKEFVWNGRDNIMFDVCFLNGTGNSSSYCYTNYEYTGSFNCDIQCYNAPDVCSGGGVSYAYPYRPIMRFISGGSLVGSKTGTGNSLDFGTFPGGNYYAVAKNAGGCTSVQLDTILIRQINAPTKYRFTVSNNGHYCKGDQMGVTLSLSGSQIGLYYNIYNSDTLYMPQGGLGQAIDITNPFPPGKYYVYAVDSSSGCGGPMADTVTIYVDSLSPVFSGTPNNFVPGVKYDFDSTKFNWTANGCADGYKLIISTNSNLSNPVFSQTLTPGYYTLPLQVSGLLAGTTYYWQVVSKLTGNSDQPSQIWQFTTKSGLPTQSIALHHGWNMISSHLNPVSTSMSDIWNGHSNLLIIKDGAGNFRMASGGGLSTWNPLNGYLVYMNAPDTLNIIGSVVGTSSSTISMQTQGWYLVSYLPLVDMQASTALASLGNKLVVAKNGNGEIYWPNYQINTFEGNVGTMVQGKGYQLYVLNGSALTYPASQRTTAVNDWNNEPMPQYLHSAVTATGNSATMVVLAENLFEGTEVGVYNGLNEIIGSGVVHNGRAAVTIWGDNSMTKVIDGAIEGEQLTIKAFDPTNAKTLNVNLTDITDLIEGKKLNGLTYKTNGMYLVNGGVIGLSNELNIQNTPNPFGNTTTIEWTLPESGYVDIAVYNLQGELVSKVASNNYDAGSYHVQFSSENLSSGVYTLVLRFGSQSVSKAMVIVK